MNKSQKSKKSFKSIHFSGILKFLKKSRLKIAALVLFLIMKKRSPIGDRIPKPLPHLGFESCVFQIEIFKVASKFSFYLIKICRN